MSRMQPRLNLAHEPEHPPRPTSQQTMMLVSTAALLAFSPSMPMAPGQAARSACSVRMAEAPLARRAFVGTFAAAAVGMAPLAAFADGAASPATRERARAIYGSRIARLSNAPAADILEEKNAFKLFISGAYRSDAATKELRGKLTSISASTIASAKAGDSSGAQAGVKVRLILPSPHTPPRAAVPEARKFKLSPSVSTSPPHRSLSRSLTSESSTRSRTPSGTRSSAATLVRRPLTRSRLRWARWRTPSTSP